MIPVPPGDPLRTASRLGEAVDTGDELLASFGISQLHRGDVLATADQMDMRIEHTRNNQSCAGIDFPGRILYPCCDIFRGANRDNSLASDSDRLDPGTGGIAGPDVTPYDDTIGDH